MASLCLLPLASAQGELTEIGVHDHIWLNVAFVFEKKNGALPEDEHESDKLVRPMPSPPQT